LDHTKELRRDSTEAEQCLWQRLRNNQLGYKFRRQHRFAGYIADFVCIEQQLIVELDGSQHFGQVEYDATRTRVLEQRGFRVLRFWNNDVLSRTEDVLEAIIMALKSPPHPNPLPRLRRGRGSRNIFANSGQVTANTDSIRDRLLLRARLYGLIRQFFTERDVLEIDTPIMSAAANTDPNIESFSTQFSGHQNAGSRERWMRTSSEFAQKRLLAAGLGDCYELGRVFRNGEAGRRHNPEFTMLEWYRVGWDHRRLIDETIDLVIAALGLVVKSAKVQKCTYRELFRSTIEVDPFVATDAELRVALGDVRVDSAGLSRDDWLDLLLTHRIQPSFPPDRITVVYDYPASQCALAKIRNDDPPVAERFELYVGAQELANGYHELTDAGEQRARFVHDNARRRERGLRELPIDENLLAALESGMPACAGVALGIERLLMAMSGTDDIRYVLPFVFADA
jgi:lysyl-tRNA synthetase class 2